MRPSGVPFRQIEAAECGLAALAMASTLSGRPIELQELRQRFGASTRGVSLGRVAEIAAAIGFATRSVRCEPDELRDLARPAILHWNMNHFVVLCGVRGQRIQIYDPARGYAWIERPEVDRSFTGVALELSAAQAFRRRRERSPLRLSSLPRWTPEVSWSLAKVFVLSLLVQAYVVASPLLVQIAVDEAAAKGDAALLASVAAGFAGFALFNAGSEVLRAVTAQRLSALLAWDITSRLFHHLVRLPLSWFQQRRTADVLTRFQSVESVRALISTNISTVVIDGCIALSCLALMCVFRPLLCLAVVGVLALYVALRLATLPITLNAAASALQANIVEQSRRLETIRAIQTIKLMGAETARESHWANALAEQIATARRSANIAAMYGSLHSALDALSQVVVVFVCVRSIIDGQMTVGALFAFLAYRNQFVGRSISVVEQLISWKLLDVYAYRLADITLTAADPAASPETDRFDDVAGDIRLEHVGFRYASGDRPVLKDVDLTILEGEHVAIVGPSGAGKSTLLKILCGLYTPSAGDLTVGGDSMRGARLGRLRQAVGAVMQDDELLSGSIADNVTFFAEAADTDHLWACLEQAELADDIRKMPMGVETYVGDMGASLSGGQRQRLLLARALYKRPAILLLDESTSNVDVEMESRIVRNLSGLGVTRIVVAHRPATIDAADRVIELRGGAVFRDARKAVPIAFQPDATLSA